MVRLSGSPRGCVKDICGICCYCIMILDLSLPGDFVGDLCMLDQQLVWAPVSIGAGIRGVGAVGGAVGLCAAHGWGESDVATGAAGRD